MESFILVGVGSVVLIVMVSPRTVEGGRVVYDVVVTAVDIVAVSVAAAKVVVK
jgi:hypothetical protein